MEEDLEPLLPSSPFVRNSVLRVTRRQKPLPRPKPVLQHTQHPKLHPDLSTDSEISSVLSHPRTYDRLQGTARSASPVRPPLPPHRHGKALNRGHGELSKSQSLGYGDSNGKVTGGDHRVPVSYVPQQGHDLARKTQSFAYGHQYKSSLSRNGPTAPCTSHLVSYVEHKATQEPSRCNNHKEESCREQRFKSKQSSISVPSCTHTPQSSAFNLHIPSEATSLEGETRKGLTSLFKRTQSCSPSRKGTPSTEESISHKHSNGSWSQTVIARLQGRSPSPSPHRGISPSHTAYKRDDHPSDMSLKYSFRRSGSLPIQKTGGKKPESHNPSGGLDVNSTQERLSRSSFVKKPLSCLEDPQGKTRGLSPWGERAYMAWPLKPYTESLSQNPEHPADTSRVTTLTNDTQHPQFSQSSTSNNNVWDLTNVTGDVTSKVATPNSSNGTTKGDDIPHSPAIDGSKVVKESLKCVECREDDPSQSISSNSSSRINSSSSNSSSRINSINSINGSSVGNSSGRQTKCSLYPRDSLCSTQESGEHSTVSRSTSVYSTDSGCGVLQCFTNRLTLIRHSSGEADKCTDHFSYLLANDNEYLNCLHDMLSNYNMMCSVTPPHIRQHLDVFFLHMETLYQFQIALHGLIKATGGNAAELSQVFTNDQFQLYSRCMIMTPNALRDFSRYSAYFEEHFPHLKRNLLKPSMRINFYVMMLDTFKNGASEKEKVDLESARDYLNQLKREANTIMTVATVVNSPLDLRLGGEVLQLGELLCLGGGSLQKKKYNIILFEHLLVITSSKMDYFKYKTHYRAERLEAVESAGDQELVLHAFTEGQHQLVTMRFKAKSTFLRDEWVKGLHKIIPRNDTSSQREGKQSDTFSTQVHSQMFPLYLFSEYPHLSSAMVQQDFVNEIPKLSSVEESCLEMFLEEKAYVRQLSSLLNPEAILPPETLCSLLEKLYQLHSKILLPYLDRSLNIYNIFRLFFENIDSFSIYVDYLVVRSQVISQFNSSETRLYISPVQHLTFYLIWLQQLCRYPDLKESAQKILDHFKTYVKKAQIRLLTDAISNARIDFYRSGNILRHDRMEVKTRKKELRGGLYLALLFENIILLTKPKPPFYEYAWDIWLDQVNLGPPTNSDVVFKLEVRQGGGREPVTCEFRVASPAIKQEWLKCMQQQMLQQAQKIRQRTSADF